MKLYLTSKMKKQKIPILVNEHGAEFVLASLGISRSILYREIKFLEDGILVFYGDTFRESEVEIIEGNPPKKD